MAMDSRGAPPVMGLRRDIARLLVDRLNDDLIAPLAAATPGVVHINSRGILPRDGNHRDDGSHELHPTNLRFRHVVEQAWLPRLFEHGVALRPAPWAPPGKAYAAGQNPRPPPAPPFVNPPPLPNPPPSPRPPRNMPRPLRMRSSPATPPHW